ncbi:MAG TPA: methylated-DNA--[protein]-cysteine S-methyltransferase [Gemmatimonadaceae bacterium]|nr:methylated-DNA--[protein]-cysteine S-methyltransferase [Gemmatimonadaceae bacterium]
MELMRGASDEVGIAFFATALGDCGIAWSDRAIVGVELPERTAAATRSRLCRRFSNAREGTPPPHARTAIDAIVALLSGERRDLSDIPVDMNGVPPFNRRVYEVARTITPGETLTYGELAAKLGEPDAARAVGQALGENPFPIVVPCHRVLAAGGRTGGFSGGAGVPTKLRMLAMERSPGPLFDQPAAP